MATTSTTTSNQWQYTTVEMVKNPILTEETIDNVILLNNIIWILLIIFLVIKRFLKIFT